MELYLELRSFAQSGFDTAYFCDLTSDMKVDKMVITNAQEDTIVSVTTSRALRQAEQDAAATGKK